MSLVRNFLARLTGTNGKHETESKPFYLL